MIGKKKPFLESKIADVPCERCGQPSKQQFSICALNNRHVALCPNCDVDLNRLVLRFVRAPHAEKLIRKYKRKML